MKLLIAENQAIAVKAKECLDNGKMIKEFFNSENCIVSFCGDIAIENILCKNTINELYIIEYIESNCYVLDRKFNDLDEILSVNMKFLKECFKKIHTDELKLIKELNSYPPAEAFSNKIIRNRDKKVSNGLIFGKPKL